MEKENCHTSNQTPRDSLRLRKVFGELNTVAPQPTVKPTHGRSQGTTSLVKKCVSFKHRTPKLPEAYPVEENPDPVFGDFIAVDSNLSAADADRRVVDGNLAVAGTAVDMEIELTHSDLEYWSGVSPHPPDAMYLSSNSLAPPRMADI
eukprot:TRINITY_DN1639_c0_g1_i1.p1 TRINITY_DN1639_c0_g1~~TRINITY_DN1639_c0_g1_i1.p1  ORF type:complete len:148 (+),score=13.68 TRINITY_DN1639_c0_g1_i1:36-479(+)